MDEPTRAAAFSAANRLRADGISAEADLMSRSLKAQFKYADKLGAEYVAVIGSDELSENEITVKNMASGKSERIKINDLYAYLKKEI